MFITKILKIIELFEMVPCVWKRFTDICICFNEIEGLELVKLHWDSGLHLHTSTSFSWLLHQTYS